MHLNLTAKWLEHHRRVREKGQTIAKRAKICTKTFVASFVVIQRNGFIAYFATNPT